MTRRKADGFEHEQFFVIPARFLSELGGNPLAQFITVTDIGYFPRARYHFRQRTEGCGTGILMYCSGGSGYYQIGGGKRETLSARQLIIIPPDTPHEYAASPDNPWSIYWVHLKGPVFTACYAAAKDYLPLSVSEIFDDRIKDIFDQCFNLLKTPYRAEEFLYLCQLAATVLALIPCIGKSSCIQYAANDNSAVNRTLAFMHEHIHEMLSLGRLAEVSRLSPSYLSYLFRRTTGHAPVDFFLHLKMQTASRDLCFSGLPVKDIAASYGIEDPYYFSRLFKKITGFSPRDYRRHTKNQ